MSWKLSSFFIKLNKCFYFKKVKRTTSCPWCRFFRFQVRPLSSCAPPCIVGFVGVHFTPVSLDRNQLSRSKICYSQALLFTINHATKVNVKDSRASLSLQSNLCAWGTLYGQSFKTLCKSLHSLNKECLNTELLRVQQSYHVYLLLLVQKFNL